MGWRHTGDEQAVVQEVVVRVSVADATESDDRRHGRLGPGTRRASREPALDTRQGTGNSGRTVRRDNAIRAAEGHSGRTRYRSKGQVDGDDRTASH